MSKNGTRKNTSSGSGGRRSLPRNAKNNGSSTRGGELHTTERGGVLKNTAASKATRARGRGRGKSTREGEKPKVAEGTSTISTNPTANSPAPKNVFPSPSSPEVGEMDELEKELKMELGKVSPPTRYTFGRNPIKKCIELKMPQSVLKKILMARDKNMKITFSNGIVII